MIIEEQIVIDADCRKIWTIFTDLTCWPDWNHVIRNVRCNEQCLARGKVLSCFFRPYVFPVRVHIEVEESVPCERVVWSVHKKGFSARHEFLFESHHNGVLITSREVFTGVMVRLFGHLFPVKRMRALTVAFLRDLKTASEK